MKLTHFNLETMPKQAGRSSQPKVSFGKAGTIAFNNSACELMKIKPGDKLSFARDADSSNDWYFYLDKQNGFELRGGYDGKGALFNDAGLIKKFNEEWEFDDDATRSFLISKTFASNGTGDKTKYWLVLVKKD